MITLPEWAGQTVVCIGGGPSLTRADVEYVRGRAKVIAINDAYRLAPWAEILYACDARWWNLHEQGVKGFQGLKFGMTVDTTRHPDVVKMRMDGVLGLCDKHDGLRTGSNSGYQAINLAVNCGSKRILLLGYDMGKEPGKKSHWFGEHPGTFPRSPYDGFREKFKSIVDPLKARGVEVINCSRWTMLEIFPRSTIEHELPDVAVCPDCDHGVRGGKPCELCAGVGVIPAEVA